MITENESSQIKNGQEKKPELPKRTTIRMALAQIRVLEERRKEKEQEAQREKKGEEVESPNVETENSQTNNPKLPNKNELPKRTTIAMALARINLLEKHRKAKEQKK